MQLRDKFAISFAGLTGIGQRGIFVAMFLTLAIASGTWCVVYGLLTGANSVSQYRIDSRPFPYRLLLGRQFTSVKQAEFEEVRKLIDAIPDNALRQMDGFRVCDWNVGLVLGEGKADFSEATKGRTIAADAHGKIGGEYHPIIRGLGLALDRTDKFEDGIFLCPRVLVSLGLTLEQVPNQIALDLKRSANEENVANVLGVLKEDPPERVYFLCPEPFEKAILTRPTTIRFGPLNGYMLDKFKEEKQRQADLARELEQLLEREGEIDSAKMEGDFQSLLVRGRGRRVSEWLNTVRSLAENLKISASDFEKVEFAASELPPYNMVELYFHSGSSLPQVVDAVDDLKCFEGEVDRTVAEMVTQLESFSAARLAVLRVTKKALTGICVVCLFVIQIMRCWQRKEQAAMLRIMGMSHWQLLQVALLDGFLVWCAGLALGLAVANLGIGPYLATSQFENPVEVKLAFQFTWWDGLWLGGFSLLLTELSACGAAYSGWLLKHPADMF